MNLPESVLLVDKPKGVTSFDVIRRLRQDLGVRTIGHAPAPTFPLHTHDGNGTGHGTKTMTKKFALGHAGTLDPLASGLMLVGIGKGTKKLAEYVKLPKTYEAEILIGERRTTGDLEGEIAEERDVGPLDREVVTRALRSMVGTLSLPVPVYSAVKRGGEPLYEKARRGERVDAPIKPMEVRSAVLDRMEHADKRAYLFVTLEVGSGTYIRSLAEELGKRLGYPATVANLRRTKIGDFDSKDAMTLSDQSPSTLK